MLRTRMLTIPLFGLVRVILSLVVRALASAPIYLRFPNLFGLARVIVSLAARALASAPIYVLNIFTLQWAWPQSRITLSTIAGYDACWLLLKSLSGSANFWMCIYFLLRFWLTTTSLRVWRMVWGVVRGAVRNVTRGSFSIFSLIPLWFWGAIDLFTDDRILYNRRWWRLIRGFRSLFALIALLDHKKFLSAQFNR